MKPLMKTELPGPLAKAQMARGAFDMQDIYRALVIDDAKSEGTYFVDVDGNQILDMFANFALGALGYNHPALVKMARSDAFLHASINPTSTPFVTTPGWYDFIERVQRSAPPGAGKIFCVDAGGEGVEAALKAAFILHGERRRVAGGGPKNPVELSAADQAKIMDNVGTDAVAVSFADAFHGRGFGSLSATHSKLVHKADLPAFPWPQVKFPANRFPLDVHAEENARAEDASIADLERVLDAHAGRVAAIIVEPIQSEGGDRHASAKFFHRVQALAKKAGAYLILDEVQTGGGPTGKLWGHEHFNLPEPADFVTFGKKMQMGGFFCRPENNIGQWGRMYQTRNGDRARAMICSTILDTIEKDGLLANVVETGAYLLKGLEDLGKKFPKIVGEPRGIGFLLAFDLPNVATRDDFLKRTMRKGVMAAHTGSRSVRLRPHLITRREEVDHTIRTFAEVFGEMA